MREPLVQTQVLPYLRELKKGTYPDGELRISILTFEPEPVADARAIRSKLAEEGIEWHSLPYHKRFSVIATAWDILRGTFFIRGFIARERPDILHGRVHVSTLMAALARKISRHKPKLLFDIRGFFPEEYTDAGVWPEGGWLYRSAKRVESWLMREADGFVVLTESARSLLFPESKSSGFDSRSRPVEVIPCCVDQHRFERADINHREKMRSAEGMDGRSVVAYVGSFGGWYLTDQMMDFFSTARKHDPNTFVMILTQRGIETAVDQLRRRGFGDKDFLVRSVDPAEIANYLVCADFSISFIKSCYSKVSSSPTKLAEYLACGLPIISNRGIGDVDELILRNGVGVLIDDFNEEDYLTALNKIVVSNEIRSKCKDVSRKEFDLSTVGGLKYRRIYERLMNKENQSEPPVDP